MMRRSARVGFILAALATGAGAPPAHATSVRAVSVQEMLDGAELVFEGRVTAVWTDAYRRGDAIRTCARYEVLDVLKGPSRGASLELCFAGGAILGAARRVEGMVYPRVGERGIFFVESLREPLVHPLYGWDQGRFPIELRSGGRGDAVKASDGSDVLGVEATGAAPSGGLSSGVARGVRTSRTGGTGRLSPAPPAPPPGPGRAAPSAPATGDEPALTPDAFKARLRGLLRSPSP